MRMYNCEVPRARQRTKLAHFVSCSVVTDWQREGGGGDIFAMTTHDLSVAHLEPRIPTSWDEARSGAISTHSIEIPLLPMLSNSAATLLISLARNLPVNVKLALS